MQNFGRIAPRDGEGVTRPIIVIASGAKPLAMTMGERRDPRVDKANRVHP